VRCRVQGAFADASLVQAHRYLLRAALADPASSHFVLVSEACVPLYHPALFWAQLLSEAHVSRVSDNQSATKRYSPMMYTPHYKYRHWRKGSQWTALSRPHALIIAYDRHVWRQFQAYCVTKARRLPAPASVPHAFVLVLPARQHSLCSAHSASHHGLLSAQH
jgi:Core-2/I-Branching enzyme